MKYLPEFFARWETAAFYFTTGLLAGVLGTLYLLTYLH